MGIGYEIFMVAFNPLARGNAAPDAPHPIGKLKIVDRCIMQGSPMLSSNSADVIVGVTDMVNNA